MSSSESRIQFCPICLLSYDCKKNLPIVYACGHGICIQCDGNPQNVMKNCHVCRQPITSRAKNFDFTESLEILEKSRKNRKEQIIYKCRKCRDWTLEHNLYICETCVIDRGFLDLSKISQKKKRKKIKDNSMCSNCIVKMHCLKGHRIVAMSSMLMDVSLEGLRILQRQCNVTLQLPKINSKRRELENTYTLLNQMFAGFKASSIEVCENYIMLTERAEQNKSTKRRKEILERKEKFINEAVVIYRIVQTEIERRTKMLSSDYKASGSPREGFGIIWDLVTQQIAYIDSIYNQALKDNDNRLESAKNSESKEEQDNLFETMEKLMNEVITDFDFLRNRLEQYPKCMIQKSLKTIKEWINDELGD